MYFWIELNNRRSFHSRHSTLTKHCLAHSYWNAFIEQFTFNLLWNERKFIAKIHWNSNMTLLWTNYSIAPQIVSMYFFYKTDVESFIYFKKMLPDNIHSHHSVCLPFSLYIEQSYSVNAAYTMPTKIKYTNLYTNKIMRIEIKSHYQLTSKLFKFFFFQTNIYCILLFFRFRSESNQNQMSC